MENTAAISETKVKAQPMRRISTLVKKNVVFLIALFAATVTCFFVPPDAGYLKYFDLRTLTCLFCTLAVVCAFKNIYFFEALSRAIVKRFKNVRNAILALVFITYFASMLLANDMALLTFLPLSYFVLSSTGQRKHMAFSFIMQNIAANLGGMLTPFGNPQNLYLYSYFSIPAGEFFAIMAPPFIVSLLLIIICCMFIKPEPFQLTDNTEYKLNPVRTSLYGVLFVLSVLIIFNVFPYYWGLLAVVIAILIMDSKALLKVDYGLLLTFCAFFIFSGNLSRIPAVSDFLGGLISRNTLLFGVLSCQAISNVPSAVLLSKFTADYKSLLLAVNIGGLGTPVASLASLISLNEYRRKEPGKTKGYLLKFTLLNFMFLAILIGFQLLYNLIPV